MLKILFRKRTLVVSAFIPRPIPTHSSITKRRTFFSSMITLTAFGPSCTHRNIVAMLKLDTLDVIGPRSISQRRLDSWSRQDAPKLPIWNLAHERKLIFTEKYGYDILNSATQNDKKWLPRISGEMRGIFLPSCDGPDAKRRPCHKKSKSSFAAAKLFTIYSCLVIG